MSSIGGIGYGGYDPYHRHVRQVHVQESLFDKIDGNGDSTISKTELENAVTAAGGTADSADALFSLLDPNNTGSVSKQQFESSLFGPPYNAQVGAQLIADQSQQTGGTPSAVSGSGTGTGTGTDRASRLAQAVFSKIDSDGDGSISKAELEKVGASIGATRQAADSLYAQLDPNNTGGVDEKTFTDALIQSLRAHHHHHGHHQASDAVSTDASTNTTTSTAASNSSALDAVAALLKGSDGSQSLSDVLKTLFAQIDTDGNGSISQSELQKAVTAAGGTTDAANALYAQLDPGNSGGVSADTFTQFL